MDHFKYQLKNGYQLEYGFTIIDVGGPEYGPQVYQTGYFTITKPDGEKVMQVDAELLQRRLNRMSFYEEIDPADYPMTEVFYIGAGTLIQVGYIALNYLRAYLIGGLEAMVEYDYTSQVTDADGNVLLGGL